MAEETEKIILKEDNTPATEVTPPAANDTPTFNEAEYLKSEFGIEDKTAIKERLTKFDETTTNFNNLQTKFNEIEPEYNKLKETPATVLPYKTEAGKYVDELYSKGVTNLKEIIQWHDVDPADSTKMSDETAIKLAAKLGNKGWEDKHADAFYASKFVVDDTDPTITDTHKTLIEADKIKAAQESRNFLSQYIGKQFTPPVDEQRALIEEKQKQALDFWNKQIPSIVSQSNNVSGEAEFKLMGSKGEQSEKLPYSYVVPADSLKAITDNAVRIASAQGIANTEEGMKQVSAFIKQSVWASHGDAIVAAALQAQQNRFMDFVQTEFHNAQPAGGGQGGGGNQQTGERLNIAAIQKQHRTN